MLPAHSIPLFLTIIITTSSYSQTTNKQGPRLNKALSTKIYQCLMVDDPNFLINDKEPSGGGGGGGGRGGGGGKKKK